MKIVATIIHCKIINEKEKIAFLERLYEEIPLFDTKMLPYNEITYSGLYISLMIMNNKGTIVDTPILYLDPFMFKDLIEQSTKKAVTMSLVITCLSIMHQTRQFAEQWFVSNIPIIPDLYNYIVNSPECTAEISISAVDEDTLIPFYQAKVLYAGDLIFNILN